MAFDSNHGGWQAVNLPPEKWQALIRRWLAENGDTEIPLFWCGEPNTSGLSRSVGITINGTADGVFIHGYHEEGLRSALERLNAHLKAMGEEPVPVDIPDTSAP